MNSTGIATCDMGGAHHWLVDAPDKHRSTNKLGAVCRKCGMRREYPKDGGIAYETAAERKLEGIVG